jgi:hypothetical protein
MSDTDFHDPTASQQGFATAFRDNTEANFALARRRTILSIAFADDGGVLTGNADEVWADLTGGAFTYHLPLTPLDGDSYEFTKIDASGNALTIGRNGETINGAAADVTLSTQWASKRLTWSTDADTWWSR